MVYQHFSFGYKTEHATKSLFLTHRQLTISSSREDFLAIPHIHHGPGATPPPPRQARYRPPPETESDALPRAPKPKRKLHGPRSRGSFFLGNLHDMLASATPRTLEIISWSPDGAGLLLFDADAFENELMPVFFPQHRRIKSFLGALYLYGFTNGPTRKEYGKGPMRFVHQTLTQASPREAFDAVLPRKSPSQIKSWELGGEDAGAQRPKIVTVAENADSEGSSKRRKTRNLRLKYQRNLKPPLLQPQQQLHLNRILVQRKKHQAISHPAPIRPRIIPPHLPPVASWTLKHRISLRLRPKIIMRWAFGEIQAIGMGGAGS
ncbi:hypothetical protein C8F01DRAFT_333049 [Mycena amicta]|nr:hypothetical protein C8F01DRAFT_333049 [Mycena amicta]